MSDSKQLLRSFLKKESFIRFHTDTARMLDGVNNAAILLQFLIDRDDFYNTKDGWFFLTEDRREINTNISAYQQRESIKILKEKGIVETKRKGIPAKTYFKIDYESYNSQLLSFLKSSPLKTEQLDSKKTDNYLIDNKEIDSSNKVSKDTKGKNSPVNKELLFLLEEWRTKEQIPKAQHHLKEDTKIQKKIAMLTNLLLMGKFGSHCTLKPEFIDQNNLTPEKINRKYSKDELLAGLDEMADMFKMNNLPEDKTKILSMGFDQLIYHPIAKMSYLLKFLWSDNKELSYKTVQVYGHWLDKLYDEGIFDKDIENDHHAFGVLKKGLLGIEEYYDWMLSEPMKAWRNMFDGVEDTTNSLYRQIDTEDKFFNSYINWFSSYTNNATAYDIGPTSKSWYRFIKWLEEAIHGDFVNQYPTLNRNKYGKV